MAAGLSAQLIESLLTPGRIAGLLFLFVLSSFIVDFTSKPRYGKSLPLVGSGDGVVGTVKNWIFYMPRFNIWVAEGYQKYTKHGRAYVTPSSPSRPNEIVIPQSHVNWMLELPDRVLSTKEAHQDVLFGDYQFLGTDDQFPIKTIHKHLARNIISLIPGVQEEIHAAIDAAFGTDKENWKTFNLWETWLKIIPRVTNRILVGANLCRNEEFLQSQVAFADDIVRNSFILCMFPRIFHPLVAPLIVLSNRYHWHKGHKTAQPTIAKRLHDMARKDSGDPAYQDWQAPEDMLTWLIRQAKIEGLHDELTSQQLSKRLLPVEFAAIHTTVITLHHLFLDLLSADPSLGYLETIHEETSQAYRSANEQWTKESLMNLHRTDSAIKESMRLSNFATALTHRKVIAPEGITHPNEGWHAPYGAVLMIDLAGTHHDGDIYENPNQYDAFRFARQREELQKKVASKVDGDHQKEEDVLKMKRLGMVTTSGEYLPFSHGRHACPGRFFVAHELKITLAYLLDNYEIKPIKERPKPMWLGATIIPPVDTTIEVRRRRR
ncbi:Ent-kaurene oxidase [Podospora australis]|uniref:Ent-kaurene oxidase n=1 Tax=Podospora australis TaxID=1536484 RepID=A0AAN6WS90_9PEZI|nr:Ent-kaurene oxidase [Podospora australis]